MRVSALAANGFSENQVQAIFFKSANGYPRCDIAKLHCVDPNNDVPDAYLSEQYLGDILRYLKCCKANGQPRYPQLRQVFVTSRIYGGYAVNATGDNGGQDAGCLSPEPYAYESAFAVERLIVHQIDNSTDQYSGQVDYNTAPWFDWGPYLWADADTPRQADGLFWCDTTSGNPLCDTFRDVRFGDLTNSYLEQHYWGDHTHPSAQGAGKVAGKILDFLGRQPHSRNPWTPWLDPVQ